MNIETNKLISFKIGDGIFKIVDKGMEGFYEFQEIRDKEGMKGLVSFVTNSIREIENVKVDGQEISVEDFKKLNLPTWLGPKLVKCFDEAMAGQITNFVSEDAKDAEKNAELPIG